jgi:hypothetical protein
MTTPADYTPIVLVSGPDTQAEDLPMVGQIVLLPPGYPLGSGSTNPSRVLGIWGWTQVGTGGRLEWLMGSILDQATVEFVRLIPARGWHDVAQRTVYRQQARRLIQLGVTAADVRDILNICYQAARLNEVAP